MGFITKIKNWIIGKVLMKKVIGKLAKHATAGLVGLLFGANLSVHVQPVIDAMGVNQGEVQAGLIVLFTGIFGASWNYIEHRFFK